MKKVINGKLYNTETAKEIESYVSKDFYGNEIPWGDFRHCYEILYQKRTGEYFLYGTGGPFTKYCREVGQNTWSGDEKITPLTPDEANQWLSEHCD